MGQSRRDRGCGEWDGEGAQSAQSAFEWMGWEGEEPLFLRRYDVQLFVWYVLPRKYLTGLDDKRRSAGPAGGRPTCSALLIAKTT